VAVWPVSAARRAGEVSLCGWFVDWLRQQTHPLLWQRNAWIHAAIHLLVATMSYKNQPPQSSFFLLPSRSKNPRDLLLYPYFFLFLYHTKGHIDTSYESMGTGVFVFFKRNYLYYFRGRNWRYQLNSRKLWTKHIPQFKAFCRLYATLLCPSSRFLKTVAFRNWLYFCPSGNWDLNPV
jgi:hypothetical protein